MSYTDKERLDFLDQQEVTKWVGYSIPNHMQSIWPVFYPKTIRSEIDHAIEARKRSLEFYNNLMTEERGKSLTSSQL